MENADPKLPAPDFIVSKEQNHHKFSRSIPPVLNVPSGSVIDVDMHDATGGQLNIHSTSADLKQIDSNRVHTITGPIYIEEANPGDVLAVEILKLQPGDWAYTGTHNWGFLQDMEDEPVLKTFKIDHPKNQIAFSDEIKIPLRPFLGVMGVAPDTDEQLSTIPPRANGGNMDDPGMGEGATVYLPVFVKGALFSIGDPHGVQGYGEVCGTAAEMPMRALIRVQLLKNKTLKEPQYETDTFYATTGFGSTIDEAAQKATHYMIQYLEEERNMSSNDAYMLCSLAGNLKIAEAVNVPHKLVTMQLPKAIFKKEQ